MQPHINLISNCFLSHKHGIQIYFLWMWNPCGGELLALCWRRGSECGLTLEELFCWDLCWGEGVQGKKVIKFLFLALQVSVNPAYQASELEFVLRKVRMAWTLCWRGHGADELLKIWVYGKSWLENRAGVGCVEGTKLKFRGHISCCSLWLMENCCLMETALSFSSLSLC